MMRLWARKSRNYSSIQGRGKIIQNIQTAFVTHHIPHALGVLVRASYHLFACSDEIQNVLEAILTVFMNDMSLEVILTP
jgi:hypothetical protein